MNRLSFIILLSAFAVTAYAQSDRTLKTGRSAYKFVPGSALTATNPATGMAFQNHTGMNIIDTPLEPSTPYYNNSKNDNKTTSHNLLPYKQEADKGNEEDNEEREEISVGGLHQGLNASLGLSVMAGFGKGAPHGAGFAQNLSATYLAPLGKKGWLAAGGYVDHLNWDGMNITNGGLQASLGYQFNDQWSAWVYGQKSIVNNGMHRRYGYPYAYGPYAWPGYYGLGRYPGYYGYGGFPGFYGYSSYWGYNNPYGDKIGAVLQWKPSPNFSLQISVEHNWYK